MNACRTAGFSAKIWKIISGVKLNVTLLVRPSVDGLMPETIMLLSPSCCFDFLMESLPSNFFLVAQNSSSVSTLLSTNCLCNLCSSLFSLRSLKRSSNSLILSCSEDVETTDLLGSNSHLARALAVYSKKEVTETPRKKTREILSQSIKANQGTWRLLMKSRQACMSG